MTNVDKSLIAVNSIIDVVSPAIVPMLDKSTMPILKVSEPTEAYSHLDSLLSSNTSKHSRLHEDFDLIGIINSGGFGLVYKAQHKLDKRLYAVKEVPIKLSPYCTNEEFNSKLQQIFSEVYLLSRLDTSYVLRYYNCWIEKSSEVSLKELKERNGTGTGSESLTSLVSKEARESPQFISVSLFISMEIASRGTLKNLYTNDMSIKTKLSMLIQITQAVSYLHKNQVAHRDITPANIFLSDNNKLKLGDFGLSTHPYFYLESNDGVFPYKEEVNIKLKKNKSLNRRGQRKKSASKIFNGNNTGQTNISIDIARDCYAVGIITIELWMNFGTNMERVLFFKKITNYLGQEKYGMIRAMLERSIQRKDVIDVVMNMIGEMSKRRNMEWVRRKLCTILKKSKYSNGK